jgi:hypothetical protein
LRYEGMSPRPSSAHQHGSAEEGQGITGLSRSW